MNLFKYNGLGNVYAVLEPKNNQTPSKETFINLCNPIKGLGTDGVLYGPASSKIADFKLRIFNPDGSEAEKSGNGLRIFTQYLKDSQIISKDKITIETLGGIATCEIHSDNQISVEMGKITFKGELSFFFNNIEYKGHIADIGNPHCIFFTKSISREKIQKLGPIIEEDPRFPNKTNVQFVKILDHKNIQMEIWERGAGYTLASGSSASAAAGVFRRYFTHDHKIQVHMAGGILDVQINDDFYAKIKGPVEFMGVYELSKNGSYQRTL